MIKNYLTIALFAFISAFGLNELSAQHKEVKKKVIVIEKSIDNDGKVVSKKVVKEGKEADLYIKKLNSEGEIDININGGENTQIVKKQAYKIVTLDENGNENTVEWNGEGEMPTEIEKMLDKEGIEINENHSAFLFKSKSGDHDEEINITFEEGEITDEVIELLKEENINIKLIAGDNKPQLGIVIKDNENGEVEVIEVIEQTAASEGGLLSGDIIRKINDLEISNYDKLLNVVSYHKAGDKLRIGITRAGKKTYKDVILKEAKDTYEFKTLNNDDIPNFKEVEKDVEIIIEKKN